MLKKILLTLSLVLNVAVLLVFCMYLFSSVLDLEVYRGAALKFFEGNHKSADESYHQMVDGWDCLEDAGYFDDEGIQDEKEEDEEEEEGFELIEEGDMGNTYEGSATIVGTYTYYASGAHGIPLTVEPDEEYLNLLPGDGERFAVANYEELLDIMMHSETKECDTYTGSITLEIDGYNELTAEIGGSDTTNFVNVLQWSSENCE